EIKIEDVIEKDCDAEKDSHNFNKDIFDNLEKIRLGQDYSEPAISKKTISVVPVRKPHRQWFFRVKPEWRFEGLLLKYEKTSESYFVLPQLVSELEDEVERCLLLGAINSSGDLFLWPIKYPSDNSYNVTALEAAMSSMERWVRIKTNRSIGIYEEIKPNIQMPEPEFPEVTLNEILRIAFKNHVIDN